MHKYEVSLLAFVLHEVEMAEDLANLGQLCGVRTPDQNLLDQSNKAIRLAEALFTKYPVGDCLTDVRSAKVPLDKPMLTTDVIAATFNRLYGDVLGELKDREFVKIADDRLGLVDNDRLFGDDVYEHFESAREDITESGNCLAAECATAAVFHLMRVAESGLRALARDRAITVRNDVPIDLVAWEDVIRELEKCESAIKDYPRTHAREAQYAFMHGAMMEFRSFKNIYRNRVSHNREPFDKDTANSVFSHVKRFMTILAWHIGEDKPPTPMIWVDA